MKTRLERGEHAGVPVLSIAGALEPAIAGELERQLLDTAADAERSLLVDLSATDDVDAKLLPVFLRLAERLEAKGARLALWVPHPRVRSRFDVLRGRRGLRAHASRDEALSWMTHEERFERIARLANALLRDTGPWKLRQRLRGRADLSRLEMAREILGGATPGQRR